MSLFNNKKEKMGFFYQNCSVLNGKGINNSIFCSFYSHCLPNELITFWELYYYYWLVIASLVVELGCT